MEAENSVNRVTKEEAMEMVYPDQNLTEEEFQNFVQRVTEVEKIVKKLSSSDEKEQRTGMLLADQMLEGAVGKEVSESEVRVKSERTVINKSGPEDSDPGKMSREAFMRSVEKDANQRHEDRKRRNERADTYKRIANGAFGLGDYEKAVTYYGKALEQRKDSSVLWNNQALSYMKLGLYEMALRDLEWALKISETNIKALLNSAKCHAELGNEEKRDEFLALARESNSGFTNFINDFEKELRAKPDAEPSRNESLSGID